MLSIRNMLTENTSPTITKEAQRNKPPALDIAFLLCPTDKTIKRHHWQSDNIYYTNQYHLLDNHHFRKSRSKQYQEKNSIEQEFFLNNRRQSSSSSSCSSISSSSYEKQPSEEEEEEEEEQDRMPMKAKRKRASTKQLDVLNKVFEKTFFPSTQLRAELGRQLGMSPRTVQIWFQNRRQAIRTRERTHRENS